MKVCVLIGFLFLVASCGMGRVSANKASNPTKLAQKAEGVWFNLENIDRFIYGEISGTQYNDLMGIDFSKCSIESDKIPISQPVCRSNPAQDCSGLSGISLGVCQGGNIGRPQQICNYSGQNRSYDSRNRVYKNCLKSLGYTYSRNESIDDVVNARSNVIESEIERTQRAKLPLIDGLFYIGGFIGEDLFLIDSNGMFESDNSSFVNIESANREVKVRVKYSCSLDEFTLIKSEAQSFNGENEALYFDTYLDILPSNIKAGMRNSCSATLSLPEQFQVIHDFTVNDFYENNAFQSGFSFLCRKYIFANPNNVCSKFSK